MKNPTWRPAELQAIDAPPALDYRTPDYTANAAKYMDLYGAKRRAEPSMRRPWRGPSRPAGLAAAAKKSVAAGIADSR